MRVLILRGTCHESGVGVSVVDGQWLMEGVGAGCCAGQVEDVGSHGPHSPASAEGRAGSAGAAGKSDSCTYVLDCTCSEAADGTGLLKGCGGRKCLDFGSTEDVQS